jgi:Family of unknown function (DUF5715)
MKRSLGLFGLMTALMVSTVPAAGAEGLAGSPASMAHQHAVAVEEQYTFLRTPLDVQRLVSDGKLVQIASDADVVLAGVSFPYARPEVRAFLARYARDYRDSTGAALTVTSLTRPAALQPRNAHKLSVHPAGMAIDFRVPRTPVERGFMERSLLAMEKAGLLDVTRERTPAHYHVAVFAEPTLAYLKRRDAIDPMLPRSVAGAVTVASVSAPVQRRITQVPRSMGADSVDGGAARDGDDAATRTPAGGDPALTGAGGKGAPRGNLRGAPFLCPRIPAPRRPLSTEYRGHPWLPPSRRCSSTPDTRWCPAHGASTHRVVAGTQAFPRCAGRPGTCASRCRRRTSSSAAWRT